MSQKELVFLLEEESAKAMLESLLPRILNPEIKARLIPFEGKQDLEKQMTRRMPIHPAAQEVAEFAVGEVTKPVGSESKPESRPESRPESTHHRIMLPIAQSPLGRAEIAQTLGHKSISGAAKQAITDLMNAGLIEYTLPEKPNSRLQKYRWAGGN